MPRKRGKKGRKKGRKKKKKQQPFDLHPPPLHDLTKLYNLLIEKITNLNQMRLLARDKRIEAWYITREMMDVKSDNQIYHDFLEAGIGDLEEVIIKIMDLLESERDSLRQEIERQLGALQKRHAGIQKRTEEVMEEMDRVRIELLTYEPLMAKMAKLLKRLQDLAKEVEAAELEADIKTRHLKNQFLWERGKLHNHLEKQLFDLIENCRTYIMPILWKHIRRNQHVNNCIRWKLAKADARNTQLSQRREDLMMKRRLLNIEKEYLGIDWVFFKLAEAQTARKQVRKLVKAPKKVAPIVEPPTELAIAFNTYLKKRLTAYHEAKKRENRSKSRYTIEMDPQDALITHYTEIPGEDDDEADMWEDIEYGGEDYDDDLWLNYKRYGSSATRSRIRIPITKPRYASLDDDEEEEESSEEYEDIETSEEEEVEVAQVQKHTRASIRLSAT